MIRVRFPSPAPCDEEEALRLIESDGRVMPLAGAPAPCDEEEALRLIESDGRVMPLAGAPAPLKNAAKGGFF